MKPLLLSRTWLGCKASIKLVNTLPRNSPLVGAVAFIRHVSCALDGSSFVMRSVETKTDLVR